MVPKDGSYLAQYFGKIFASPLALTLHIHFITLKIATFSVPEITPKLLLKLCTLCYFSKT